MFQPSHYSDTTATSAEPSAWDKLTSFVQQAAPVVSVAQELVGKTSLEKLEILRARVKNYQRLMHTPPYSTVPGTAFYQSEITKMKAQIKALEVEVAQDQSATQDYSIWRKLTSVGGLVGIGVGCGVIYFLVKKANA